MMDQKTRLLNTIKRRPVDRTPFICPGGMMTMAVTEVMEASGNFWPEAHTDAAKMAALTMASNALTDVENVGVPFCMTVEAESMGSSVDLGTKHIEPRITQYAIKDMSQWPKLARIRPDRGRAATCVDAIAILKKEAKDIPVIANLTGPISLAASLVDPLLFYKALLKNKDEARSFISFCEENLMIFGEALIDAGADFICIADPSATGELIGQSLFREYALPGLNRISDFFQKKGVPVIVHICGNVTTLGRTLSDLKADIISIDSLVSIRTLKELAGDRLTMGNVSTFKLEKGTEESIFQQGVARIKGGVDILAPACGISPKTSIRNIKSLSAAASKLTEDKRGFDS